MGRRACGVADATGLLAVTSQRTAWRAIAVPVAKSPLARRRILAAVTEARVAVLLVHAVNPYGFSHGGA